MSSFSDQSRAGNLLRRRCVADPEEILKNGVDAYVYVRFLIMMSKAFVPIWMLSWLVLIPIDSVGTSVEGKTGLDKLTFGAISDRDQHRLWHIS